MKDRLRGMTAEKVRADMRLLPMAWGSDRKAADALGVPHDIWFSVLSGASEPTSSIIDALYGPEGTEIWDEALPCIKAGPAPAEELPDWMQSTLQALEMRVQTINAQIADLDAEQQKIESAIGALRALA